MKLSTIGRLIKQIFNGGREEAGTEAADAGVETGDETGNTTQAPQKTSGNNLSSAPNSADINNSDINNSERTKVLKTYKLFIKGEFPRSESGRSFPVESPTGELLAHASLASRKDLRAAVEAADLAQPSWASKTAYNRGQILYRVAEIMETRAESFAAELASSSGKSIEKSRAEISSVIDCWVWYAGWADKFSSVLGSSNPVSGPYFNFTTPEPMGIIGVIIGENSSNPLLPLVSRLAPAIVSGNSVVLLAPEDAPLPAISLAEVLATSDIPAGVVNILTGKTDELAQHFMSHINIDAVDITAWGWPKDGILELAADSIKRVIKVADEEQSPYMITNFCEMKTVWHPIGK